MPNVVLTSPAADTRSRDAVGRALARFPATVEDLPPAARGERLRQLAARGDVEWIAVIDADVVLRADAFASLRRVLDARPALVGGRALVGASQRLGAMFAPPRSGPNPFELVPLTGPQADPRLAELARGPVDAPQRGAILVAAEFVRSLGAAVLDPVLLHLELAVHARAAGRAVVCEPALTFEMAEDSRELRGALVDLRRYAAAGVWQRGDLHRDPPRLRAEFIMREVRVMGNYRGFIRRPYPPIDVLQAGADGAALRTELARSSDRYLLVAAGVPPARPVLEALVERIERNGRTVLVLESATPPYGAALFHCGRITNGAALAGDSTAGTIAEALESLPQRGYDVAALRGSFAARKPAAQRSVPRSLDVVFVAAAKPTVTHQTLQALLGERVNGTTFAVYPAGAATTARMLAVHRGLRALPDASDVHLAVGLNRALGACGSEVIAIVRDDVQLPHGLLARLQAAFARIPRLGAAVPRVGGNDRPESLPDQSYRNSAEMQAVFDRRAESFAREAMLVDVATTPVIMIGREALEVVGGFDETFGFSRLGVEDYTRRLRSANFFVARCDDAYAHLFPPAEAASLIGNLDDAAFLRAVYEERWASRHDFEPQRDRVPLRADDAPVAAAANGLRILLPLGNDDEFVQARPLLASLAATYRAHDPVEVAVGLDGTFGLQPALAAIRELLLESAIPMEETLNISIDFVPDVGVWRDAGERRLARAVGGGRAELEQLRVVGGADDVRALLAESAG